MDAVRKLELMLEVHYKKLPHLPDNAQKWLATNAWWLVLIGVVIGVFAILGIMSLLGLTVIGLGIGGAALGSGVGAAIGAAVGGVLLVVAIISLALYIAETVLMAMAIMPLKEMKKRGWDLLFLVAALNAASVIVVGVLTFDLFGLIWSLLWVLFGTYFLYEVRDYFMIKKATIHKAGAPVKAKLKA